MIKTLSSDLAANISTPYFMWDEPMTVSELKKKIESGSSKERTRLLGKVLREARDTDVWKFTKPQAVWDAWHDLAPHLGRRRLFWEFILKRWREEGLIGEKKVK